MCPGDLDITWICRWRFLARAMIYNIKLYKLTLIKE